VSVATASPTFEQLYSEMGVVWAALFVLTAIVLISLVRQNRVMQAQLDDLQSRVDFSARRRRMAMELFHTLGSAFESEVRVEDLLRHILRFFMRIVQASGGCAFLTDKEKGVLVPKVTTGRFPTVPESSGTEDFCIPVGEGVIGKVAQLGRAKFVADGASEPGFKHCRDKGLDVRNAIAVPLSFRGDVLGVVLVINRVDDPARPGQSFGRFEYQLLESLSTYAAVAVHLVISYLAQTEKQRLHFDLTVASEIQRLLLPQNAPTVQGFSISGTSRPAHRVGGDYFDFLPLDEARLGVVIADVSGKGVTGALVMGICRSIVRTQVASDISPSAALQAVRQWLLTDLPEDMFVTMTYGILDRSKQTFTFARAGHDPLLHFDKATGQVRSIAPQGPAIGLIRNAPSAPTLEEAEVTLNRGDAVVLFTDGITESLNPTDQEFGRDTLQRVVANNAKGNALEISCSILDAVLKFSGSEPAHDDQTVVVLKADEHQ
jgi:sigma-B regulation protein RsbU (phosphoserine phosphatase)